ncbi:MAG TPA: leucine-rich repeat protein [Ruminococcus sp.]|nr:leucine-rich repeat protein [Ruminococcus sp.]
MKKRLTVLLTTMLMLCSCVCPLFVFAVDTDAPEFDIENGVLVRYNGADSDVEIPDGVTAIGEYAFYDKKVQRVSLPDSVTKIGDSAFSRSTLTGINFPEGLQSIGNGAFQNTWITEANIPYGVTEIPSAVFFNSRLTKVTIPDTVTQIGESAFGNTPLQNVDIPDSVTYAASSSFSGTPFLRSLIETNGGWLILSNGLLVVYAGDDINVVIPDSVKRIGTKSFTLRSRMQSLTIPDTVKSIEEPIFINCKPKIIYSTNPIAKKLNITCSPAPEIPPTARNRALDLDEDTWQFANIKDVFGDTYLLSDAARSQLTEQIEEKYQTFDEAWNGSCHGLVITALLIKYGLLSPADLQEGAATTKDISPESDVQSVINYYQFLQFSKLSLDIDSHSGIIDVDYFEHIISLGWQAEEKGKPFLLSFETADGGHACAGCGIESGAWEWDGKNYDRRIILWDPNFPTEYRDDVCFYYREVDYDYCIPFYGVKYSLGENDNVGEISAASDEISELGEPPYPFEKPSFVKGDVNADGILDIADVVLLQKWLLAVPDTHLPQWRAADLCNDERLDVFDLCLMKRELLYR